MFDPFPKNYFRQVQTAFGLQYPPLKPRLRPRQRAAHKASLFTGKNDSRSHTARFWRNP